jgi:hypothetical protein
LSEYVIALGVVALACTTRRTGTFLACAAGLGLLTVYRLHISSPFVDDAAIVRALETWLVTACGIAVVIIVARWTGRFRLPNLPSVAGQTIGPLPQTSDVGAVLATPHSGGDFPYWFGYRGTRIRHDDECFAVDQRMFSSERAALRHIDGLVG